MTYQEFEARFRGQMMLFVADAWAARRCPPSELGMLMDKHLLDVKRILREQYESLAPKPAPITTPIPNGTASQPQRKV